MSFSIDANIPDIVDKLNMLKRKQIPFATALALTLTAADGQKAVKRSLPSKFIIRSPWTEKGIRIKKATKKKQQSMVFSRDPYMLKQEEGGKKRPTGTHSPIPRAVRKTPKQRITKARRPRQIVGKPTVFIGKTRGNSDAIFQRIGKKGRLKLLYILHRGPVTIKPRFQMRETVQRIVRKVWKKNFGKAFARALSTAR